MSKVVGLIMPHDKKDMGWLKDRRDAYSHWYRTSNSSRLAVSHCRRLGEKASLQKVKYPVKCSYCAMVEQARDGLKV